MVPTGQVHGAPRGEWPLSRVLWGRGEERKRLWEEENLLVNLEKSGQFPGQAVRGGQGLKTEAALPSKSGARKSLLVPPGPEEDCEEG